jgi:hypothetical protein
MEKEIKSSIGYRIFVQLEISASRCKSRIVRESTSFLVLRGRWYIVLNAHALRKKNEELYR